MLRYQVKEVQSAHDISLSSPCATSSSSTSLRIHLVTLRCGEVHLLRSKSSKGDFFTPVISTNYALLLFPNIAAASPTETEAAAEAVVDRSSPAEVNSPLAPDTQRTIEAFLSTLSDIPFDIVDAALCLFSGCAILLLRCPDVEDVLAVQHACTETWRQTSSMRTSKLYVQGFLCHNSEPSAEAVAAAFYYIPTCPLCADRLETNVSGRSSTSPLCECLCSGSHDQCSCFLTSSCLVCRRFAESFEQGQLKSNRSIVKCEACGQAGDPWICLICGYVGCSRYQAMHAKDHCLKDHHFFSMNLLTQQIWDYDGDCFVHRVVILPDARTGGTTRMQFPGRDEPVLIDEAGDEDEVGNVFGKKSITAKYDKKLTSSHTQYAMVIKSELDSKRAAYESQLESAGGSSAAAFRAVDWDEESGGMADMSGAFDSLNAMIVELSAKQRKVTALSYGVRNLEHELSIRTNEGSALERQIDVVQKEVRGIVQQNVTNELKISGAIHELEETLRDVNATVQTQRRLAQRLGSDSVTQIVAVPAATQSKGGNQRKTERQAKK